MDKDALLTRSLTRNTENPLSLIQKKTNLNLQETR